LYVFVAIYNKLSFLHVFNLLVFWIDMIIILLNQNTSKVFTLLFTLDYYKHLHSYYCYLYNYSLQVKHALPLLSRLLLRADIETATDACWAGIRIRILVTGEIIIMHRQRTATCITSKQIAVQLRDTLHLSEIRRDVS
jgi:hypothetical protein